MKQSNWRVAVTLPLGTQRSSHPAHVHRWRTAGCGFTCAAAGARHHRRLTALVTTQKAQRKVRLDHDDRQ